MRIRRRQYLSTLLSAALFSAFRPRHTFAETGSAKRILLLGDSMIAGALGLFLERNLKAEGYQVHRKGQSSTGLARPDFFDWIKEAHRQVQVFPNADATVIMFGGNDVQGLRMPKSYGERWIRWDEEGWWPEYARRIHELANVVAPQFQHLFWIGMPVMRPEKFHTRVQRINRIARAEMAIRPNATFIDIWHLLADEQGRYTDRLAINQASGPQRVRVRAGDGVHLSIAGANLLEDHVRTIINQRFRQATHQSSSHTDTAPV